MLNTFYQSLTKQYTVRILYSSIFIYFILFSSWCYLKFIYFQYYDFDFAIHDQVIWNIGQGSVYNSILGVNFLGNHIHFISFLVAPIYRIFCYPLTLLFLQTLSLALAAIPIYKLAKDILGYRLGLVVALVYLLYPGLGYTNLYEFHPTVFATFFLSWMYFYFFRKKFGAFVLFMLLSIICQENISLGIIALGIYAFCTRKDRRYAVVAFLIGIIYFIFCVKILLPYFNQDTIQFIKIYGQLGGSFPEIIKNILTNPFKVAHIIVQPQKIKYLIDLFLSLSFIPLLSPLSLILSLPFLAQHLLSSRANEITLYYHYTAELIPALFVAFILGMERFRHIKFFMNHERFLAFFILMVALLTTIGLGPHFNFLNEWRNLPPQYKVAQKESLMNQIPKEASVISTFEFLPHLSHRRGLYSFHHIYSGFFTLSSKPYHFPDDVTYALIDFNDPLTFRGFYGSKNYRSINTFLKKTEGWGVVDIKDSIVLFKKGAEDKYSLFSVGDKDFIPHQFSLIIDNRIELYGYHMDRSTDLIHIILYWKLLQYEKKDVNIAIDFIDQNNKVIAREFRPICYRIWPTQAWQGNQSIKEHHYISIPPMVKGRLKRLMIGFYDYQTGEVLITNSKDVLGRIELPLTSQ